MRSASKKDSPLRKQSPPCVHPKDQAVFEKSARKFQARGAKPAVDTNKYPKDQAISDISWSQSRKEAQQDSRQSKKVHERRESPSASASTGGLARNPMSRRGSFDYGAIRSKDNARRGRAVARTSAPKSRVRRQPLLINLVPPGRTTLAGVGRPPE